MDLQRVKQRYGIVGNSEGLNHALDVALQVAPTDLSVLIQGESGVGKEHFPRLIHDSSIRKHGKYFAVNCGSIPEGTIDSELFGHMKGSFTGAVSDHVGYFEAANGGTLFLDEVGELPMSTQARLLRVLESGEFIRVGSSEVRKTNVRIVAATNVNMQKAIVNRKFREDLYYRLNTIPIQIPALRERKEDIPLLFRKFAGEIAEKYNMPPVRLADDQNVYHLFPVFCEQRDDFQAYLAHHDVKTVIHYPIPPHKQECYKQWNSLSLPVTERIHQQELSLPMSPAMTHEEAQEVVSLINRY